MSETTDESTGITKRVVIDWRSTRAATSSRRSSSRARTASAPSSPRGGDARYLLSVDAILSVEPGEKVKAGDVLARIPLEAPRPATSPAVCRAWRSCSRRVVRRITRSSPRSPARPFGRDYKNKRRIIIEPHEDGVPSRSST
jgi:DNA-directed RNA polymerase subunit beta'